MTPEEAHKEAATSFYNRLLSDSKQLDNMRFYCREMGRQLPCDVDPYLRNEDVSKELRIRYGLNPQDNNIVWAILEDWFKNKIWPKAEVTVKDIPVRPRENTTTIQEIGLGNGQ